MWFLFFCHAGLSEDQPNQAIGQLNAECLVSAIARNFQVSRNTKTYRRDGQPQGPLETSPGVADHR